MFTEASGVFLLWLVCVSLLQHLAVSTQISPSEVLAACCKITASRPCFCRLAGAFSTSTNRCLFVKPERLRSQSDESDPWRAHVSTLEMPQTLLTLLNKWTVLMKKDSSTGFVLAGFHFQHFSTFNKCLFCFTSSRALEEEEVQSPPPPPLSFKSLVWDNKALFRHCQFGTIAFWIF